MIGEPAAFSVSTTTTPSLHGVLDLRAQLVSVSSKVVLGKVGAKSRSLDALADRLDPFAVLAAVADEELHLGLLEHGTEQQACNPKRLSVTLRPS